MKGEIEKFLVLRSKKIGAQVNAKSIIFGRIIASSKQFWFFKLL